MFTILEWNFTMCESNHAVWLTSRMDYLKVLISVKQLKLTFIPPTVTLILFLL